MPILKTLKNGVWVPVSGISEHTHTKDDITDFPEDLATESFVNNKLAEAKDDIDLSGKADIVRHKSGSIITLDNAANTPIKSLSIYGKTTQFTTTGKNLFDKENAETVGGYIDPNGNILGNASIGTTWFVPVSENTKYTISTNSPGGFYFRAIRFLDAVKSLIGFDAKGTNTYGTVFTGGQSANYFATATFTTPEGCKYVQVGSLNQNFGSDSTIMLNYGDTALSYEPYTGGMASPNPDYPQELDSLGASGNIGVTVAGKNLLPKASAESKTSSGITLTSNGDGSYSVKGTAETGVNIFFSLEESCVFVDGLYVHLMNNVSTGHNAACVFGFSDGTKSSWAFTPANRIGAPTSGIGKTITQIGVYVQSGYTIDVTFSPMLVSSDTAMDFVPYKPIQTLNATKPNGLINTPNGLPGIPVSSGGNYIDESGQQWICDEIDFARGVYVQRVKQFVVNENTTLNKHTYTTDEYFVCYANNTGAAAVKNCISNLFINNTNSNMLKTSACIYIQSDTPSPLHFSVPINIATDTTSFKNWAIENDLCVLYPLATPTETALSPEELEAYALLHTNKPNTTMFNDAGADMEIAYYTPTTAVQMVHTPADAGKILSIDEHGCVVLVDRSELIADVIPVYDGSVTVEQEV